MAGTRSVKFPWSAKLIFEHTYIQCSIQISSILKVMQWYFHRHSAPDCWPKKVYHCIATIRMSKRHLKFAKLCRTTFSQLWTIELNVFMHYHDYKKEHQHWTTGRNLWHFKNGRIHNQIPNPRKIKYIPEIRNISLITANFQQQNVSNGFTMQSQIREKVFYKKM